MSTEGETPGSGGRATVQQAVRTPQVADWTSSELSRLSASIGSPMAWLTFLQYAFSRSRQDAREMPALQRSLRRWMLLCSLGLTVLRFRLTRRTPNRRGLGWLLGTSLMAEWHLGMIPSRGAPTPVRLDLPNRLTLLRSLLPAAASGLDHHIGERRLRAWIALAGLITDFGDGWLARRTRSQTHFGTVVDPLADAALWTTLAMTNRSGRRARILGLVVVLRYAAPIALALTLTFQRGRTYDWFPSTPGRWSSGAFALLISLQEVRTATVRARSRRHRSDPPRARGC